MIESVIIPYIMGALKFKAAGSSEKPRGDINILKSISGSVDRNNLQQKKSSLMI